MILTIVGGSAQSTPRLIDVLARSCPNSDITVRLVGRDRARLDAVVRACTLLAAHAAIQVQSFPADGLRSALTGSDVVLIQARVGGYAGRSFDESFSLPFSVPGDEGLGAGGLSAAYRAWPQMQDVFWQVHSAAPNARVILLSSPGSLLVRLAALTMPGWPLVATCELPGTTLNDLCTVTGTSSGQVQFSYTGVNHLGFLFNVYVTDQDRTEQDNAGTDGTDDVLARFIAQQHSGAFPSSALVSRLGGFPLKYLRLHFEPEEVAAEQQRRSVTRADELAALADHAFAVFREGEINSIRRVLSARPADWYEFAVLPLLLTAMGIPVCRPMFLSIADDNGDVRERAYVSRRGKLEALPSASPAPTAVESLVRAFASYEHAAVHAVLEGSAAALAGALALHPSIPRQHAAALAEAIVNQPLVRGQEKTHRLHSRTEELCVI